MNPAKRKKLLRFKLHQEETSKNYDKIVRNIVKETVIDK